MTDNSRTFLNIIDNLNPEDLDVVRGFIRDTVRAEWGDLIRDLADKTYGYEGQNLAEPGEPLLDKGPEPTEVEDEGDDAPEQVVNVRDYKGLLSYLGLSGITIRFDL